MGSSLAEAWRVHRSCCFFKRIKKHINLKFMYKLNKVCTWSSRIGHFESSRIRCSQKHKHTHTLPSFSWEWVLNITHNRIRRSKFNQWLTHTHALTLFYPFNVLLLLLLFNFQLIQVPTWEKDGERHHYVHRFPLFGLSSATWFDKRK
jgi:hypothetical protein